MKTAARRTQPRGEHRRGPSWHWLGPAAITLLALILVACGGGPAAQNSPATAPTAAATALPAATVSAALPTATLAIAPTELPATISPPTAEPTAVAPTVAATETVSTTTNTGTSGPAAIPTMQIVKAEDTKTIDMSGDYFSPIVAVVHAGDTVTWVNKDSDPHSVVSYPGDGATFDIDIDAGKSGAFTFDKPGIYRYYCDLHATYDQKMDDVTANQGTDIYPAPMRGVIVVLGKDGNLPTSASATVDIPAATMAFAPWSLVVPAGAKVTWTNHDPNPHSVVSAPGYATRDISTFVLKGSDGTGSADFATPGVYYYYCPTHAKWDAKNAQVTPSKSYSMFPFVMDGLIVVTPKA